VGEDLGVDFWREGGEGRFWFCGRRGRSAWESGLLNGQGKARGKR
jgi:hypothetical protein